VRLLFEQADRIEAVWRWFPPAMGWPRGLATGSPAPGNPLLHAQTRAPPGRCERHISWGVVTGWLGSTGLCRSSHRGLSIHAAARACTAPRRIS